MDWFFKVTADGCETVFTDGTSVPAVPHDTDEYRQRAQELGYGDDTLAMCRDHELTHSSLAALLGLPHSPTLWSVAHPEAPADRELQAIEETAVLAIQRFKRALRR